MTIFTIVPLGQCFLSMPFFRHHLMPWRQWHLLPSLHELGYNLYSVGNHHRDAIYWSFRKIVELPIIVIFQASIKEGSRKFKHFINSPYTVIFSSKDPYPGMFEYPVSKEYPDIRRVSGKCQKLITFIFPELVKIPSNLEDLCLVALFTFIMSFIDSTHHFS